MDEPHLELTPEMDEREILARVAQFIWDQSSVESRSQFEKQAEEQAVDCGKTVLLRGLIEDRLKYASMESWLCSLPGYLDD